MAGASPEVIAAIAACNMGLALPYGHDALSQRLQRKLSDIFEREVSVFLVSTGSAANALSLATLTPPWGSVLSHAEAHINRDECGAPEFYTNGAKLVQLSGPRGKIDLAALKVQSCRMVGDVHSVQPSSVSISQATELGTVYSLEEIAAIGSVCREAGLGLHMDGARFANGSPRVSASITIVGNRASCAWSHRSPPSKRTWTTCSRLCERWRHNDQPLGAARFCALRPILPGTEQ
jgi:threonine aldolase